MVLQNKRGQTGSGGDIRNTVTMTFRRGGQLSATDSRRLGDRIIHYVQLLYLLGNNFDILWMLNRGAHF